MEVFRMGWIHADAGSLLLNIAYFHMPFSPVSVVFGQHHRAWWDIILDGPISQGKQVVWFLCCDVQQLGFPCHLFPESPRHISCVWNGTFSLGSQDLIKQRCCLNSHINLLTLRYSASPLFIVRVNLPQMFHSFVVVVVECSNLNFLEQWLVSKISLVSLICRISECSERSD